MAHTIYGDATYDGARTFSDPIVASGGVTNPAGVLKLGTAAASGEGLGAGDVVMGGALEVDGIVYCGAQLYVTGFLGVEAVIGSNISDPLTLGTYVATSHALTSTGTLVGGALEVDGATYLDGAATIAGLTTATRIVGTSAVLELGSDTATSHSLGANDVMVGGALEVNDALWVDSTSTFAALATFNSTAQFNALGVVASRTLAGAGGGLFFVGTGNTDSALVAYNVEDQFVALLGSNQGRQLVIGDMTNGIDKDFDHATPTNPTVFVHSAVNPDTDNTQWLSLAHDQTNGVIATGKGDLTLSPATGLVTATTFAGTTSVRIGPANSNGCLIINSNNVFQVRTGDSGANQHYLGGVYYSISGAFVLETLGSTMYGAIKTTATPESAVTGAVGSTAHDGTNGRWYNKATGTGNTGWIEQAEHLLKTTTAVDLSSVNKTTLYTVPTGKVAYVTRVVVRDASAAITLATASFGYDANATDVIAATAFTTLADGTLYINLAPISGAKEGAAAAVFGIKTTVQEGAADTVTIDVFGYLR